LTAPTSAGRDTAGESAAGAGMWRRSCGTRCRFRWSVRRSRPPEVS